MKGGNIIKTIWNIVKILVTLWSFFSIVAIIADALQWLPYYDIYYRKKTYITPVVFLFPGQQVRLSAEFAKSVELKDIEGIVWNLKDSSGKEYTTLPHLRDVDFTLVPDYSGIINVKVKAKLFQEKKERYGVGSIYIVQTKSQKFASIIGGKFLLHWNYNEVDPKSVQLYVGSSNWVSVHTAIEGLDTVRVTADGRPFPVWDGKTYLRYKHSGDPSGLYRYEVAMTLN